MGVSGLQSSGWLDKTGRHGNPVNEARVASTGGLQKIQQEAAGDYCPPDAEKDPDANNEYWNGASGKRPVYNQQQSVFGWVGGLTEEHENKKEPGGIPDLNELGRSGKTSKTPVPADEPKAAGEAEKAKETEGEEIAPDLGLNMAGRVVKELC